MDRLISKATPAGTLSYTYDAAGHVATIASSNPNGASVAYTWDDLNRLSAVTDNRLNGTTAYTYDAAGNLATVHLPQRRAVHLQLRLLEPRLRAQLPGLRLHLSARRRRAISPAPRSRAAAPLHWSYDGIYRLTSETVAADPSQNQRQRRLRARPGRQSHLGELLASAASTPAASATTPTMKSPRRATTPTATPHNRRQQPTYDSENHMISMTNGGTTITMIYDAFGNRVAKTVNGVTNTVSRRRRREPHRLPASRRRIIRLGGAVTAHLHLRPAAHQPEPSPVTGNSTWTPSFYVYDGGGSVRQLDRLQPAQSPTSTSTTPTATASPSPEPRPTTTSIAANSTTPISASTTSAPDTTIPPLGGSCPAIRMSQSSAMRMGYPSIPRRSTSICTRVAIR